MLIPRVRLINEDARSMHLLDDESVHLAITSPPYFNTKKYSDDERDIGNLDDFQEWLDATKAVWKETYRVLASGRKFFLNIMDLPVKFDNTFRSLNMIGKSIDACEDAGFIYKRSIIWHKTNGVKAHFGSYPYPGGILLNNMHESILEFEKPAWRGPNKYKHVTEEEKEQSKLDKDFWLSLKNTDVWLIKPEKSGKGREHLAPFPMEIPERLIRAYSYVNEWVLDPFVGSGTTMAAAIKWNRRVVGYEINTKYCSMALERIGE